MANLKTAQEYSQERLSGKCFFILMHPEPHEYIPAATNYFGPNVEFPRGGVQWGGGFKGCEVIYLFVFSSS